MGQRREEQRPLKEPEDLNLQVWAVPTVVIYISFSELTFLVFLAKPEYVQKYGKL